MSFHFVGRRHEPLPLPPTCPLLLTHGLPAAPVPAVTAALQALLPDLPSSQRMGNRGQTLAACGLENSRGMGARHGRGMAYFWPVSPQTFTECQPMPGPGLGQKNTPGEQDVIPALGALSVAQAGDQRTGGRIEQCSCSHRHLQGTVGPIPPWARGGFRVTSKG